VAAASIVVLGLIWWIIVYDWIPLDIFSVLFSGGLQGDRCYSNSQCQPGLGCSVGPVAGGTIIDRIMDRPGYCLPPGFAAPL
jgi:hypothetical protein